MAASWSGPTSSIASWTSSSATPRRRSSADSARRDRPRPWCRDSTQARAKAGSSIRPASVNRSSMVSAAGPGMCRRRSASASWARVRGSMVSSRRQICRAAASGSAGASPCRLRSRLDRGRTGARAGRRALVGLPGGPGSLPGRRPVSGRAGGPGSRPAAALEPAPRPPGQPGVTRHRPCPRPGARRPARARRARARPARPGGGLARGSSRHTGRAAVAAPAAGAPSAAALGSASSRGPTPSFSLIFFSISLAMSGLSLRNVRAFSLPWPSWSPS